MRTRECVALLRGYFAKEDGVLLPMAEQMTGPMERARLDAALERSGKGETGEGVHERYLGRAGQFEAVTKE